MSDPVQSMQVSAPSLRMSNPSLMVSEPSIRPPRKESKFTQALLIVLVLFALVALAGSIVIGIDQVKTNKDNAEREELLAREVRRVNPQILRDFADDEPVAADEPYIFLNLSSTPSGADVYLDGEYIGTTASDRALEKRLAKSDGQGKLIFYLDGYRVARRQFPRNADYPERVTLEKIPVEKPVAAAPSPAAKHADKSGVVENKGFMIDSPRAPKKTTKKTGKSKQNAAAPTMDIVLPD